MNTNDYTFRAALPVWEVGTNKVMNRTITFTAVLPRAEGVTLALAGATSFIVTVNGKFLAHGPARCAHGFFRVDLLELSPCLTEAENRVEIRVVGYNVNSYAFPQHTSFLCAEITAGDKVLAATGVSGFTVTAAEERIIRTQRYSFQRPMTESYTLAPGAFDTTLKPTLAVEEVPAGHFICRDMPYSDYEVLQPTALIARGKVGRSDKPGYYVSREISNISDIFFGYRPEETDCASQIEYGKCDFSDDVKVCEPTDVITLPADSYADVDFGRNETGIYVMELDVDGEGELLIGFDEVYVNGQLNPFRMGTSNILCVKAVKGHYSLVTAEPYVMRYARLVAVGCSITLTGLHLRHVAFPASEITACFTGTDPDMKRIFDAAVETFRANTVDIYMDCPSRERAGWLCDSFFTSRVERTLTGKSCVERAFLQNFLLPESFGFLPEGMLPMCYPSDHNDGVFIPNWAMWYGVELGEYLTRTGDRTLVDQARARMYGLIDYFKKFENEYGLLESLESWIFIEWSKSNELVRDVSFASNMLYAKLLDTLGTLYGDADFLARAAALRKTINDMAMTESGFYCDNANRVDGKLVLSGERTESCQYYAFFCDVATPETRPWLWETLVKDFGYDRKQKGLYPEIWPANAFIGNYLRLDLLDRYGVKDALYDNVRGYFTYMADTTGTLWEHDGAYASCNHGFASHVLYWMDHLGLLSHE